MEHMIFKAPHRADAVDRAVAGSSGAALSKEQVKRLILAAIEAHRVQQRAGLADEDFDAFRHAAAWEVCGVRSFRALQQRHYDAALARFRELAGRDREAAAARSRLAGDPARRALASLRLECAAVADAWGGDAQAAWNYADRCSMAVNKAPLAQASERGVWRALFTLRRRAGQLRRKNAPGSVLRPVCAGPATRAGEAAEASPRGFAGGRFA